MSVPARFRRQAMARPRRPAVPRQRPGSGRKVPSSLREAIPLQRGERVLLTCKDADGDPALIATDRALYHRDGGWSRSGWEQVATVGWDSAAERLVISALSSSSSDGADSAVEPRRTSVPLPEPGVVPELARERITHTRLGRWTVPLPGGERVTAEARRRPVTGELSWIVIPAGTGPAPADGAARAQLGAALARLSAELGFSPQPRPGSAPGITRR